MVQISQWWPLIKEVARLILCQCDWVPAALSEHWWETRRACQTGVCVIHACVFTKTRIWKLVFFLNMFFILDACVKHVLNRPATDANWLRGLNCAAATGSMEGSCFLRVTAAQCPVLTRHRKAIVAFTKLKTGSHVSALSLHCLQVSGRSQMSEHELQWRKCETFIKSYTQFDFWDVVKRRVGPLVLAVLVFHVHLTYKSCMCVLLHVSLCYSKIV